MRLLQAEEVPPSPLGLKSLAQPHFLGLIVLDITNLIKEPPVCDLTVRQEVS